MTVLVPEVPRTIAVNHLDVQHVANVARRKGPKATGQAGVVQDSARPTQDGLIPSSNVRVSLVNPWGGGPLLEPKLVDRLPDFAAVVGVDVAEISPGATEVL